MDKKRLADVIDQTFRLAGGKATCILADQFKNLGFKYSTTAGISICVDDMVIPDSKKELLKKAEQKTKKIQQQYDEGLITQGERYNKVVDIWTQTSDQVAKEMMDQLEKEDFERDGKKVVSDSFNSIYIMADSGARGTAAQIRQLGGMRGLMAKPSGEIIETPITANFREGLTVLQYFISTHGARKGLADTALKTANSGYLTRKLVDVAQDMVTCEMDCGTTDYVEVGDLVEGGEVIQPLTERVLGRTVAKDVLDPYSDEVLIKANSEVTESHLPQIEQAAVEKMNIRSALTCRSQRGVCVHCYGRDLSRGKTVELGEAVGIVAAQSIGEPGTQLTMRTFHLGGTASLMVEQSFHTSSYEGQLKLNDTHLIQNKDNKFIVMKRNSTALVCDESGRERERFSLVYGATLHFKAGDFIKKGDKISEWDPYTSPIISELTATVVFEDIKEGMTLSEQVDPVTGFSTKVVIESKVGELKPRILLTDEKGKVLQLPGREAPARYTIPVGAQLMVNHGDKIFAGDIIARIHRETSKTKDITGGLPRVAELVEARKPKEAAVIAEIDGYVSFGRDLKGKQRVIITPEKKGEKKGEKKREKKGDSKEYLIPKGKHLSVREGEFVRAGESLMDGPIDPHDILRVLGVKYLASYLVNEIQEVYRFQGVGINDKHIEVIVRQMLHKVQITDPGGTSLLAGDHIEKHRMKKINMEAEENGQKPATYEPLLLGITKVALSTRSWISAASFQETTKVLTEAAISSKMDNLLGLKESVIMGRLVPAGTGLHSYHEWDINVQGQEESSSSLPSLEALRPI